MKSEFSLRMKTLVSILLLLPEALTAAPAAAKRTCRVLFLNPLPGAPAEIFLFDRAKSQKVELPSMNLSDVYEIPAAATGLRLLARANDTAPQEAALKDFRIAQKGE